MDFVLHRRAEVAIRSLGLVEQKEITRSLDQIHSLLPEKLKQNPKVRKALNASGENIYIYRGSQRLRLVLSINENLCTVEDIVEYDDLDRLLHKREQQ